MASPDLLRQIPLVAGFRESANELIRHAFVSPLAPLLNREAFASVAQDYDRTLELRAAIAFIDLTGFKDINDREGYDIGNICIGDAGKRLAKIIAETTGIAFHFSGDEFVAVFDPAHVGKFADLFVTELATFDINLGDPDRTIAVRATCGFAVPGKGIVLDDLRKRAEKACKFAKRSNQPILEWNEEIEGRKIHDLRWRCRKCSTETRLVADDDGTPLPILSCPLCATPRAM